MRKNTKFTPKDGVSGMMASWESDGEDRSIDLVIGNESDNLFVFYRNGCETQALWLSDEAFQAMVNLKRMAKVTNSGVDPEEFIT